MLASATWEWNDGSIIPKYQGDAMSSAEVPEFVTVDDYLAAEALALTKSEYVDGWVRAMSGSTLRHNRIIMNGSYRLMRALEGRPCQPFNSDTKLRIRTNECTRFYYPDLQVVCDSNPPTSVFQDSPVLIVEVLSPSTRRYDLDEKMNAYLQIPSLQCYILLEQHQPIAIVLRRSEGGFLRQLIEGVEGAIELPFLGCQLAMRDLYDGIEFTPTCVQEDEPEYVAQA
jgi:Uma2 family endonuclease